MGAASPDHLSEVSRSHREPRVLPVVDGDLRAMRGEEEEEEHVDAQRVNG